MCQFLKEMEDREMIAQISHPEELKEHLNKGKQTAYIGFDPTAKSLTAGHLLPIMALKRWKEAGHNVVVLLGGGTGQIGDPSGKTEMRQLLVDDTVTMNIQAQTKQFEHLLGVGATEVLNTADWIQGLIFLQFMRQVGRHFPVSRMLAAEAFKARLGEGLTFFEMGYMLLQSYDFRELRRTKNVTVQMGGDDQWSNMLAGVDLIRRMDQKEAYVLTVPLLTTSDGKKMGKTEKGTVWLDAELTSPWDFFQYWRNVEDAVVKKCLMWLTDLPIDRIKELTREGGAALNNAKQVLAESLTSFVHSPEIANEMKLRAEKLFQQRGGDGAPEFHLEKQDITLIDLLVRSKLMPSKGEARRMVQQGGICLDGEKQTDPNRSVNLTEQGVLIKKGKKTYLKIIGE